MKTILLPLDSNDCWVAATKFACQLARPFRAKIVGITAKGLNSQKRDDITSRFRDQCNSCGVWSEMMVSSGSLVTGILEESRFQDLVVMRGDMPNNQMLEKIVKSCFVPLILVAGEDCPVIERVVIAFDGGSAATQALHQFISIASGLQPEIRIVAATSRDDGQEMLTAAQNYLETQDITNVTVHLVKRPIYEEFKSDLIDWADLCVLGASAENRQESSLMGNLSSKLIHNGGVALFISH